MGDARVRFIASGLAIAVGICATTRLVAESTPPPNEVLASELAAELGRRALATSSRAGADAALSIRSEADAATALCRGAASAALLDRPLTSEEIDTCKTSDLSPVQTRVAFAVAAIGVPIGNTFVDAFSLDQLRMIFGRRKREPLTFRALDPRWPNLEVAAVGVDASGTARTIVERSLGASALSFRGYPTAADVAAAIENDAGAIGFFGPTQPGALAHALRLVPIRNRDGEAVYATRDSLESESYPLGATLWLISGGAARAEATRTFSQSWLHSMLEAAGSADCLAFVERAPHERVAER